MTTANVQIDVPQFKDFLTVLENLLRCGLLNVVSNAMSCHKEWLNTLSYGESTRVSSLRVRLASMKEMEIQHGAGCFLDLTHPTVAAMIKWKRLNAEMIANSKRFKSSSLL